MTDEELQAKRDELARARATQEEWRNAFTGKQLSEEVRDKFRSLRQETDRIQAEIGLELVARTEVGKIVLDKDDATVTLRLPRDVLSLLLVHWDSGLAEEEQAALGLDIQEHTGETTHLRTVRIVREISANLT